MFIQKWIALSLFLPSYITAATCVDMQSTAAKLVSLPVLTHVNGVPLSEFQADSTGVLHRSCVFQNSSQKHFAILSTANTSNPVIAYSDNGGLPLTELPSHILSWIQSFRPQQPFLGKLTSAAVSVTSVIAPIPPMMKTNWNQRPFYNDSLPIGKTSGLKPPAGCVPIAFGQMMKYFAMPKEGIGHAFNSGSTDFASFSVTMENVPYKWENMPNEVTESNPEVAQFMRHLGAALNTNYGDAGSGTSVIMSFLGLRDNFGYIIGSYLRRENYTEEQWDSIMYKYLAEGLPIFYTGDKLPSAHAFVIDGVDQDGYYHINWGWGANGGNGYFDLNQIDYTNQEAIFGMKPDSSIIAGKSLVTLGSRLNVYADSLYSEKPIMLPLAFYRKHEIFWSGSARVVLLNKQDSSLVMEIGTIPYIPLFYQYKAVLDTAELSMKGVSPGEYLLGVQMKEQTSEVWEWPVWTSTSFTGSHPTPVTVRSVSLKQHKVQALKPMKNQFHQEWNLMGQSVEKD